MPCRGEGGRAQPAEAPRLAFTNTCTLAAASSYLRAGVHSRRALPISFRPVSLELEHHCRAVAATGHPTRVVDPLRARQRQPRGSSLQRGVAPIQLAVLAAAAAGGSPARVERGRRAVTGQPFPGHRSYRPSWSVGRAPADLMARGRSAPHRWIHSALVKRPMAVPPLDRWPAMTTKWGETGIPGAGGVAEDSPGSATPPCSSPVG